MTVVLNTASGDSLNTFGSGSSQWATGSPTNNGMFSKFQPFSDSAADDKSAPGQAPKTFGDTGSTTDAATPSFSTPQAGNSASMGFDTDVRKKARGPRGGGMGKGGGGGVAQQQLLPDEDIGMKPAKPGGADEKDDGPSRDDLNNDAIEKENLRQGHAPDYTINGNMNGRNASFDAGATSARPGATWPGAMSEPGMADGSTGAPSPNSGNNIPAGGVNGGSGPRDWSPPDENT